jgi:DNA-binding GntR family transcriptional regulator
MRGAATQFTGVANGEHRRHSARLRRYTVNLRGVFEARKPMRTGFSIALWSRSPGRPRVTLRQHRRILQALRVRKGDRAAAALRVHLRSSWATLRRLMAETTVGGTGDYPIGTQQDT